MSRHEYENVDHMYLPNKNATFVTYYCADGNIVNKEKECKDIACAKKVEWFDEEDNTVNYYILCNNYNRMFNPREIEPHYKNRGWKYRKVDKPTFNLYTKFLKEKYHSLLLQAERRL